MTPTPRSPTRSSRSVISRVAGSPGSSRRALTRVLRLRHNLPSCREACESLSMEELDARPRLRIGIDTGGTFTDIVSVDGRSGDMRVTKVASTPANPAIGLVRGVAAILAQTGGSI